MGVKVGMYVLYLAISAGLSVWVAGTIARSGRSFLEDVLGEEKLAAGVNRLLVTGFYLVDLGLVAVIMRTAKPVATIGDALEILSVKVGSVLLVLGLLQFGTVLAFGRYRNGRLREREGLPPAGFRTQWPAFPPAAYPLPVMPFVPYAGMRPPFAASYPIAPRPNAPYSAMPYPATAYPATPYPATPYPATPYPAAPQPAEPYPPTPSAAAQFAPAPWPSTPQPAAPQPAAPQPAAPQPAAPQPAAPQPAAPQPAAPQPAAPQPAAPQPSAPQPSVARAGSAFGSSATGSSPA